MRVLFGLVAAIVVSATMSLVAHHSFNATYDATKPVTLTGTVTRVEFRNPHIWIFVDAKEAAGVTNWGCEGGAPNQLFRQGWRPDTLQRGETVTIEGFASRSGKPACNMRTITRAVDGRRVFAGANDGAPGQQSLPGR